MSKTGFLEKSRSVFEANKKAVLFSAVVLVQLVAIGYLLPQSSAPGLETTFVKGGEERHNLEPDDMGENPMDLQYFFGPPAGPDTWKIDREGFEYAEYHLNDGGFRDRDNYRKQSPKDTFRIAFYGDSFIFGEYMNNSQVWTHLLEERLNNDLKCGHEFEVMNMGINAYDNPYAAEFYRQEGSEYDTDLDFFIMKNDDIWEAMEILRPVLDKHKTEYAKEHGERPKPGEEDYYDVISEATAEYQKIVRQMDEEKLIKQQVREPIKVIGNTAENRQNAVIFTAMVDEKYNDIYREEAEEHGLRFVSMNKMGDKYDYEGLWGQFSFPEHTDPHPNVPGNKLISDYVFIYLVHNNLIDCNYYSAFQK